MNKKPLFIVLIIALAAVGIVAVSLFIKKKDAKKTPKPTFTQAEPEEEPEEETESQTINA